MKNLQRSPAKQSGFSLLELAVSIAIIGVIYAVANPLLSMYFASTQVDSEIQATSSTLKRIYRRYNVETLDASFDTQQAIDGQLIPKAYRTTDAGRVFNTFGGDILITGVDGNGLTWSSAGFPTNICSEIVAGYKLAGDFEEIDVNGTNMIFRSTTNSDYDTACAIDAVTFDIVLTKYGASNF
jgi:prepilin-type N-terminal cleavage/methylation domain-containing protein